MSDLSKKLDIFLDDLDLHSLIDCYPDDEKKFFEQALQTFIGEARASLELVEQHLDKSCALLEIGAGLCITSLFLKSEGYNITALEPYGCGFGYFSTLQNKVLSSHPSINLQVLQKSAEDLSPELDGTFDLIFSNNVLEHIQDLNGALTAAKSVMNKNGKMIHCCPNYLVPYEPHFGVPVLWFYPKLTAFIWKEKLNNDIDLWKSLNFVTSTRIKRISKNMDCHVYFEKFLTFKAFNRLNNDPLFKKRHQHTFAGKLYKFLTASKLLNLTRFIPARIATPMIFTVTTK